MLTYITLLRGINVSGQKMIKMEELKSIYRALNFKNVRTYLQSGNVIFDDDRENYEGFGKIIEAKILQNLGFTVSVIIRSQNEFEIIVNNNPFLKIKHEDSKKLYVTFLSEEPNSIMLDKIKEIKFPPDEFIIIGKEIYGVCYNGYGTTKFTNNFFESKLKVAATTRNWRTVNELNALAKAN